MGRKNYSEKHKDLIHVNQLVWHAQIFDHELSNMHKVPCVGPVLIGWICPSIVKFIADILSEASEEWLEDGTQFDID